MEKSKKILLSLKGVDEIMLMTVERAQDGNDMDYLQIVEALSSLLQIGDLYFPIGSSKVVDLKPHNK